MTDFESAEDTRLSHARVSTQQPEVPSERVQVPQNLYISCVNTSALQLMNMGAARHGKGGGGICPALPLWKCASVYLLLLRILC